MSREPARPYGDGYNLGRGQESGTGYRWNGNPNRIQEGAAPPAADPPQQALVAADGTRTIVVRPGDTLYSLARQHGVSVAALAEHNRLMSNAIFAGQRLALPPSLPR
jgi:LysM repeat protein